MSPTQRTLVELRKQGYLAEVVERFNHHTMRRHDLYGIGDIIAVDCNGSLLVQCTSGSNGAARVKKAIAECGPNLRAWLAHPSRRMEVHAWRKLKTKTRQKWFVRRTRIDLFYADDPAGQLTAVLLDE